MTSTALKLLSWNTEFGGGTSAAIALADREAVDVLMLQEAQPTGKWGGGFVGAEVPHLQRGSWGSWILVRSGKLEHIEIEGYTGWVAGAKWCRDDADSIYLFSIHSPSSTKSMPRESYVDESRKIVFSICEKSPIGSPLIIGGDFIFMSFGERLSTESLQTEEAESKALQEFRTRGLSIAWQDCHPGEPLPQTLRRRGAPAILVHCDGFLTRGFSAATITCDVLSSESETQHSDHNPVIMKLSPPTPSIKVGS